MKNIEELLKKKYGKKLQKKNEKSLFILKGDTPDEQKRRPKLSFSKNPQYLKEFFKTRDVRVLHRGILDKNVKDPLKLELWNVLIDSTENDDNKARYIIASGIKTQNMICKLKNTDLSHKILFELFFENEIYHEIILAQIYEKRENIKNDTDFTEATRDIFLSHFESKISSLKAKDKLKLLQNLKHPVDIAPFVSARLIGVLELSRGQELPEYAKSICLIIKDKPDLVLKCYCKIKNCVLTREFLNKFFSNSTYEVQKRKICSLLVLCRFFFLVQKFGQKLRRFLEKPCKKNLTGTAKHEQTFLHEKEEAQEENPSNFCNSSVNFIQLGNSNFDSLHPKKMFKALSNFTSSHRRGSTFARTVKLEILLHQNNFQRLLKLTESELTARRLFIISLINERSVDFEIKSKNYSMRETAHYILERSLYETIENKPKTHFDETFALKTIHKNRLNTFYRIFPYQMEGKYTEKDLKNFDCDLVYTIYSILKRTDLKKAIDLLRSFLKIKKDDFLESELLFITNTLFIPDGVKLSEDVLLFFKTRLLIKEQKPEWKSKILNILTPNLYKNGDFFIFYFYILQKLVAEEIIPQDVLKTYQNHFIKNLFLYISQQSYSGKYFPIAFECSVGCVLKKLQFGIKMMQQDQIF